MATTNKQLQEVFETKIDQFKAQMSMEMMLLNQQRRDTTKILQNVDKILKKMDQPQKQEEAKVEE